MGRIWAGPRSLVPVTAIVVMAALVGAGCGSDKKDGGAGGTTTPGSGSVDARARYIAEADAICLNAGKARNKARDAARAKLPDSATPAQLVNIGLKITIPMSLKLVSDLRKIPAPAADEAELTNLYTAVSDSLNRWKTALASNPGAGLKHQADIAAQAKAYGFKRCLIAATG
jgi:hypothetical protein